MEEDKQTQQFPHPESTPLASISTLACRNLLRAVVLSVPPHVGGLPAVLRVLASIGVEVLDHFDPSEDESDVDSSSGTPRFHVPPHSRPE